MRQNFGCTNESGMQSRISKSTIPDAEMDRLHVRPDYSDDSKWTKRHIWRRYVYGS